MAELPHLVQVANEFAAQGGRVVGISQDYFLPKVTAEGALAAVQRVVDRRAVTFPMLVLVAESTDGLNELYRLPGPLPCTIALDAAGKEVDRVEGGADLERLRQMMRRALGL